MGFIEPLTIKEVVNEVHKKGLLLPAIQREFVWSTYQIERLFDSIMRKYPISSFLFWDVDKDNCQNYQFYEFLRDYHERDGKHNPKANLSGESGIRAVLDGQQRLTALYIGLKGSYRYKEPRKRWDNNLAFPKRMLHLNLLRGSEDSDFEFEFKFLTSEEVNANSGQDNFWFPAGEILNIDQPAKVNTYLLDNGILQYGAEKFAFANNTLYQFFDVVHSGRIINGFLESSEKLDKVLNIFIRVNSGGTQLSYSDLLLSIATAQWAEKDAREEISSIVDEINAMEGGFDINKDFILKTCLVLSGTKDIAFKVDNFNHDNMIKIESKWDKIKESIQATFNLLSSFGYNRDTLTSNNAVIPIALYFFINDNPKNFHIASIHANNRTLIKKWLMIALLKRTFGGQPDNVLRPIRDLIINAQGEFPYTQIIDRLKSTTKSMHFGDEEIYNLFFNQYGKAYTFSSLALLYPSLDYRNKFHQDHIFPKHLFTPTKLRKRGYSEEKIKYYLDNYNYLANLQLLEGIPNQEKSGKLFDQWLSEEFSNPLERANYMKKNYIPDIDLSIDNFEEFIEKRKCIMIEAFKDIIGT